MFSTLNKNDVSNYIPSQTRNYMLMFIKHAKKKRILADRYANTNIMRSASMDGIKERSDRFIDQCTASVGGTFDIFVSVTCVQYTARANMKIDMQVLWCVCRCIVLTIDRPSCIRI